MITVHHLNASRSTRVIWLLEELQMPYQLVHYQRDESTRLAPASLGKIHPLNKAPVIEDGDVVMCESGAVMEYILDQDAEKRLRPDAGTPGYYRYLEWLHFAEGSLSLPLIANLLLQMEQRDGTQPLDGYLAKELALDFSYIESTLADSPYFAGDTFSAADIMMTFMLEIAQSQGVLEGRTNTLAYLERIHQRSAYQKARSFG
ncbi:glutathione S-transferase family protein [Endozoicomonas acroporae]|uniref:glutathione S-transferase family protein n=1 Tax=Endozoicomonas acroporae TaxID=1701104 RepID=UPI000C764199|nr:glutathione S-transferase [Endozoicomonas acroporae]